MRVFITIAQASDGKYRVLRDPDSDVRAHKKLISDLARAYGRGPRRVLLLSSDGVTQRNSLALPDEIPDEFFSASAGIRVQAVEEKPKKEAVKPAKKKAGRPAKKGAK